MYLNDREFLINLNRKIIHILIFFVGFGNRKILLVLSLKLQATYVTMKWVMSMGRGVRTVVRGDPYCGWLWSA